MENRRPRRRSAQHLSGSRIDDGEPGKPLDPEVELAVDLAADEREVISAALVEWGGSARPTDELVIAMGFASLGELTARCARLLPLIRDGRPLRPLDWKRVLVLTEICFISDYFGAGWEWETVTGLDDQTTLLAIREVQDKLIGIARAAVPPSDDRSVEDLEPN